MSAESRPSVRFSFNAAVASARAAFPQGLRDVIFVKVDRERARLDGAPQSQLKDDWLSRQVTKAQRRKGSFVDYNDDKTYCFVYTGQDRRALLGHIENLHLTFNHECGHTLDPDLSKESYGANSPYHETVADCFAVLTYLKAFPQDRSEVDLFINERDLSYCPYDTGDDLRRAVALADKIDLQKEDGPGLFRRAQKIAAFKKMPNRKA